MGCNLHDGHVWVFFKTETQSTPDPSLRCLCGLYSWQDHLDGKDREIEIPEERLEILK
jgi:hypothetical protein